MEYQDIFYYKSKQTNKLAILVYKTHGTALMTATNIIVINYHAIQFSEFQALLLIHHLPQNLIMFCFSLSKMSLSSLVLFLKWKISTASSNFGLKLTAKNNLYILTFLHCESPFSLNTIFILDTPRKANNNVITFSKFELFLRSRQLLQICSNYEL